MEISSLPRRQPWTILGAILGVAFFLRAYQLHESLWIDELHTSWCASGALHEVAPRAAAGNQSPAFFYIPWLLVQLLGQNEIVLRLPSLIAGILLVAAVYGLVLHWTSDVTGAQLSAGLIAINPTLVFFSQEARPYAAIQLLAVLHIWTLWKAHESPQPRWRVYFVMTAVTLFYLHYTTVLILLADVAILAILFLRHRNDSAVKAPYLKWWLDFGVILLTFLPAMPQLRQIAARRHHWQAFVEADSFLKVFELFSLPQYALCPWIMVAILACWRHRAGKSPLVETDAARFAPLVAAWYFVPVINAWILTKYNIAAVFWPRYVNVVAATPMLLAGLAVAAMSSRAYKILMATIIAATSFWYTGYIEQWRTDDRFITDRQEDWRAAVNWINDTLPSQAVLLFPNIIEDEELTTRDDAEIREYCLFPLHGMYALKKIPSRGMFPFTSTVADVRIPAELLRANPQQHGVILIVRGSPDFATSAQEAIQQKWLHPQSKWRPTKRISFGNVTVICLHLQ